ncbi:hypothetical protein RvY_18108 [Ramazzottius varieornatus]|uniref:Uncharacterized protein n=1 Tax=Ramazzottius varieornatus TaxID=947166 RepID=A0A1D1W4K6_RAMVA|nr:hypothetical protein RvY_18108 [Ramazzottius varieornatus]
MGPKNAPEVIQFHDPDKAARALIQRRKAQKQIKRLSRQDEATERQSGKDVGPPKSVKLRQTDYHDMLRYGISNLKGSEKSQARMRLAIELGAKRPKQDTGHFKTFLKQYQSQKEEQQQAAQERQVVQLALLKSNLTSKGKGHKKNKRKSKKAGKNEIAGSLDGQVGKYNRGIQFISPKDLAGDRKSGPSQKKGKRK